MRKPKIGIRPIIDGRRAERENLEEKVMAMAYAAKELIETHIVDIDGDHVECVVHATTISGSAQAVLCADKFAKEHVVGTLHNLKDEELFQPHSFGMFGTRDTESAGRTACSIYGPLY